MQLFIPELFLNDPQLKTTFVSRFGRRELTLFSLYLSIPGTVVCSIVADYKTLLLSRALIGFCIGLSFSTPCVMMAELASNKTILHDILMISATMYAVGGVWSSVLGYILLDLIGWRIFLLLTSLPFFIPPIFMLHFCFLGTSPKIKKENTQKLQNGTETAPNFVARTPKLGLFCGISSFQGWLTILLVPALIQMLNIREAEPNSDCSLTVTQGAEFLLLSVVSLASLFGKSLMHYIREKISFQKLQVMVALANVSVFAVMITKENIAIVVVTNFMIKFFYGISTMNAWYIFSDIDYFGAERFALGSGIAGAMGIFGGVGGTAMVAFAPIFSAIITALVLSAVQIVVVLSMTEVQ